MPPWLEAPIYTIGILAEVAWNWLTDRPTPPWPK